MYKTNGGTVHGALENCTSGEVLLVPQEAARRGPAFLRSAPCGATARYEITAVRPGEYYVLALSSAWYSPLFRPELDADLLLHASRITVREGAATVADLRAMAAER